MNQKQQHAIEYLREENRVLRERLGTRPQRLTDDQRRHLASEAKLVRRRLLNVIANIVMMFANDKGTFFGLKINDICLEIPTLGSKI